MFESGHFSCTFFFPFDFTSFNMNLSALSFLRMNNCSLFDALGFLIISEGMKQNIFSNIVSPSTLYE